MLLVIPKELTIELFDRLRDVPRLSVAQNSSSKCHNCRCDIKSMPIFIQFGWLEFCSYVCVQVFIVTNEQNCVICTEDCDFYCSNAGAYVIGNQLHLFCAERCARTFFALMQCCKFCQCILDIEHRESQFCQAECEQRFNQLYETPPPPLTQNGKNYCCECRINKSTSIRLSFAGDIFEFCSFSCYFYRTLLCGLFPGKIVVSFDCLHFMWMNCIFFFGQNNAPFAKCISSTMTTQTICIGFVTTPN